jgi:hypothetical protein
MLHSWMDGRMVEEHRRDLMLSATGFAAGSMARSQVDEGLPTPAAQRSLGLHPLELELEPDRARSQSGLSRRPLGHQVGTLLIRAGTRLGGASMRTS